MTFGTTLVKTTAHLKKNVCVCVYWEYLSLDFCEQ